MTRTQWGQQFDRCFVCGRHESELPWTGLQTHEIARGQHRNKGVRSPACWLRVCVACHENGLGTITEQLALKKLHDPENYDRVAVNMARNGQPEAITEEEVDAAMEAKP